MQSQSSQAATIFEETPWLRYRSFNSDILWNLLSPFLGGGRVWMGLGRVMQSISCKPINLMEGLQQAWCFNQSTSTFTFLHLVPWRAKGKLNREELDSTRRVQCAPREHHGHARRSPSHSRRVRTLDAVEGEGISKNQLGCATYPFPNGGRG